MPTVQPFPIKGSVAVLTGAASGIGAALAMSLARRGCHLALTDRQGDLLSQIAGRARTLGVEVSEHVFDIRNAEAIAHFPEQMMKTHPGVNILINCAGVALAGTFNEVSMEEFEWLFDINFWAVVRMMKAFVPLLEKQANAQIVNISSVFGLVAPPNEFAYAASKFAVRGLSESVRHGFDIAGSPIGVSIVYPAGVQTNIALNTRAAAGMSKEDAEGFENFKQKGVWKKVLSAPPEGVAETIVQGIERRQKRILCGPDSARLDMLQRLLPVGYWKFLRMGIARKITAGPKVDAG